ncbi:MAG: hypothetical protein DRP54_01805 [Spirochaetes bacterium]|nr:MAG: hypothetical protein DRP54_01805 [Spirochaetota bacterium]
MSRKNTSSKIILFTFSVGFLVLILSSCATTGYRIPESEYKSERERIVEYSYKLLGKRDLVSLGESFRNDCSGFILGLFSYMGYKIELEDYPYVKKITKLLYLNLRNAGLIYRTDSPKIADVAFFRATVPRDRGVTHMALVVGKKSDGTILMLHYGSKGVSELRMNIRKPSVYMDADGTILNDFLLKVPASMHGKRLAGELFYCFGDLLEFYRRTTRKK